MTLNNSKSVINLKIIRRTSIILVLAFLLLTQDLAYGADFWALAYRLPLSLFEKYYSGRIAPGRVARANFYKCGDETEIPHYGAWNPVGSPKPDFHLPEYFGRILF
jgi:hypothetical protein